MIRKILHKPQALLGLAMMLIVFCCGICALYSTA